MNIMRSLSIGGLFKKGPQEEEMEKQRTNSYPPSQETVSPSFVVSVQLFYGFEMDMIRVWSIGREHTYRQANDGLKQGSQLIGDALQTEIDPLAERGAQEADHVQYKTLKWWHCGVLMIAECISLGILSLPHSMAIMGLVP